ncbi:glycosyltransferase family 4 protein [Pseudomonas antarctica]|uniref:glycosyltransferase family 4 protein n=1 Tax=Pseudomonas antarctica TaxID=219572 RepID=UPI00387B207B
MKVLMGTESLRPPLTGIGNYALNLIREFQRMSEVETTECFDGSNFSSASEVVASCDSSSTLTAGEPSPVGSWKASLRSTLRCLPLAYRAKAAWSDIRFKRGVRTCQGFVYHEPNFILKPYGGPQVTTVHDLSFVRHPEFHPAERVAWLGRQLPRTLDRADFVITDSKVVRTELIEQFRVPANKVRAIYLGADARFFARSAAETDSVLAKYGLTHGNYLAFVGTIEPRKGLSLLLDAWQFLPPDVRRSCPLVIAGAPGWSNSGLMSRIHALQAKGEVKFLQFVSSQDLPFIYAGAAIFIYPSIYEGFGLPVLEAMASGVPVICGAGTSMAEFAEGACSLFELGNCEALALAISSLIEAPQQRALLVGLGTIQASHFSWARCARETAEVYAEAEQNHS